MWREHSTQRLFVTGLVLALFAAVPHYTHAVGGDTCATATVITSLPYSDTGDTSAYNDDYYETCDYTASGAPDVVYSYTPASDMVIDIDLCDSAYDTRLFVFEDTCSAPGSGVRHACNDDTPGCGDDGFRSRLEEVPLTAGHTYYIVVDGYSSYDFGNYELNITQGVDPTGACCDDTTTICQDGVNQSACDGRFDADTLCANLTPACGDGPGDTCAQATQIATLPFHTSGDTTGYSDDYYEVCPYSAAGAPDVVYSYTPASDMVIDIDLCNSDYNTKVLLPQNLVGL